MNTDVKTVFAIIKTLMKNIQIAKSEIEEIEMTSHDRNLGSEWVQDLISEWSIAYEIFENLFDVDTEIWSIFRPCFQSLSSIIDDLGKRVAEWES